MSALRLLAFEIGMLALSEPERARLQRVFELAGIEFDPRGGVKLRAVA
jgi:hypothetical protein